MDKIKKLSKNIKIINFCSNCDRELPNKKHKTKNGKQCIWCDVDYHRR